MNGNLCASLVPSVLLGRAIARLSSLTCVVSLVTVYR
jgi:hypothetical protein